MLGIVSVRPFHFGISVMDIQEIEDNKIKLRKQQTRLEKLADKILAYNSKKPKKSKHRKERKYRK